MTTPTGLLDMIKADLGITGNTDDAWLTNRLNGIWSRIERYTNRQLCVPPAPFLDDWGRISRTDVQWPLPFGRLPRVSIFLRYFPVKSIDAVELEGNTLDATKASFDPRTGKLFSLDGTDAHDLSGRLWGSHCKITYKAGFEQIPGDLYEIVLGAITPMWQLKQSGGAGGIGGTITGINVTDVGSVEVGSGTAFVQGATKNSGTTDPLLGPYLSMLDLYVDHRNGIGSELMPVTEPVVVEP